MVKAMDFHFFVPLPGRVIRDKELSALDFRVLSAIASRDRMNSNRQGCWESVTKLSKRIGCDTKSFSRSARKLEDKGYVASSQRKGDKRKRVYRVIYNKEADAIGMGITGKKFEEISNQSLRERLQDGHQNMQLSDSQKEYKSTASNEVMHYRIYSENHNTLKRTLSDEELKCVSEEIEPDRKLGARRENWNSGEALGNQALRSMTNRVLGQNDEDGL